MGMPGPYGRENAADCWEMRRRRWTLVGMRRGSRLWGTLAVPGLMVGLCLGACGDCRTGEQGPFGRADGPAGKAAPPPRPATGDGLPKVPHGYTQPRPPDDDDATLSGRCTTGDLQSCLYWADRLRGRGAAHYAEAVALYRSGCDRGHQAACSQLGLMYQDGLGVTKDPARALTLYKEACDAKVARACSRAGSLYSTGTGTARDMGPAFAYSKLGCDGNDGMGCVNLGVIHITADGVPRDMKLGVAALERACQLDEGLGCMRLGDLYANGAGVDRNVTLSVMFTKRACGLENALGCGNMGINHQMGFGVEKDPLMASRYFERACTLGEERYCELMRKFEAKQAAATDDEATPPAPPAPSPQQ